MQKIATFLMFNDQAEAAMKFYASVFKEHFEPGASPLAFKLFGQDFYTYNGGPHFHFSQGISLFINCADQAEVDYYWEALSADGGEPDQCGWVRDQFGLSWQVIPARLMELVNDPDRDKAKRATDAMLQMHKIDIAALEAAAAGTATA